MTQFSVTFVQNAGSLALNLYIKGRECDPLLPKLSVLLQRMKVTPQCCRCPKKDTLQHILSDSCLSVLKANPEVPVSQNSSQTIVCEPFHVHSYFPISSMTRQQDVNMSCSSKKNTVSWQSLCTLLGAQTKAWASILPGPPSVGLPFRSSFLLWPGNDRSLTFWLVMMG